ncbi:MAG: orotate phosphoribosyltransferase [Actinomycetota bacterium]|nr:orotate phosphoribosyltransferase [Actinomycetota bacterium]
MRDPGRDSWLAEIEKSGALKKGHFRLSSGLHSDTYIQCAQLLKEPMIALRAGRELAELSGGDVDLVVCPAIGGIIIGFTVSVALGCPMIFAERVNGMLVLRRGFKIEKGDRVLLVEDVITTGGSVMELARIVEENAGIVAGVAAIIERGSFGKPRYRISSLTKVEVSTYSPGKCPLCLSGIELLSPGSRYSKG